MSKEHDISEEKKKKIWHKKELSHTLAEWGFEHTKWTRQKNKGGSEDQNGSENWPELKTYLRKFVKIKKKPQNRPTPKSNVNFWFTAFLKINFLHILVNTAVTFDSHKVLRLLARSFCMIKLLFGRCVMQGERPNSVFGGFFVKPIFVPK